MKITGIIAEFNPLHNGHALLFKRAREITGADIIIVILSGAFVQRGAPALFSKYARSEAALACGADLIVELPVFSACASAEYFAEGALRLLFDLGADSFVFGSEAGTLEGLLPLSGLLCEEPQEYRIALKDALATGLSFPAARKKAVLSIMPDAAPLLDEPNNLLGLEYLKVCKKRGYPMKRHLMKSPPPKITKIPPPPRCALTGKQEQTTPHCPDILCQKPHLKSLTGNIPTALS